MKKYFYDDIDNVDEVEYDSLDQKTDGYGISNRINLDEPDDFSDVDDSDIIGVEDEIQTRGKTLLTVLRDELKTPEYNRGSLDFKFNGEVYEGVPMLEINPDKFVFKLLPSNKLKTFRLSDIIIMDA